MIKYQEALDTLKKSQEESYLGETVSKLDHALQAAYFALRSEHSQDVVIASLFHDIGHCVLNEKVKKVDESAAMSHKEIAAKQMIEWGFSEKIATLVYNHVDAKRYLAACNRKYQSQLSELSQKNLESQGGPMDPSEMIKFAEGPYFRESLQVRTNNERAKISGLEVPGIDLYEKIIRNL